MELSVLTKLVFRAIAVNCREEYSGRAHMIPSRNFEDLDTSLSKTINSVNMCKPSMTFDKCCCSCVVLFENWWTSKVACAVPSQLMDLAGLPSVGVKWPCNPWCYGIHWPVYAWLTLAFFGLSYASDVPPNPEKHICCTTPWVDSILTWNCGDE